MYSSARLHGRASIPINYHTDPIFSSLLRVFLKEKPFFTGTSTVLSCFFSRTRAQSFLAFIVRLSVQMPIFNRPANETVIAFCGICGWNTF
jgi:hypothetical protein